MFNPNEHMMKLKGKDYLQVMWRLVWFREDHPDWSLDANVLEMDAEHAVFKAVVCDENGVQKSVGHGSESKRDFGDFLEKAETKAVGRALAMLGYGTQFAADELDEGERIVDSPVARPHKDDADEPIQATWQVGKALTRWAVDHGISAQQFNEFRLALVAGGVIKDIPSKNMTPIDFDNICHAIEANYGDQLHERTA